MSNIEHWTEAEAVAVLRALNAELDEDDALSAWQVVRPMVVPLHRYRGAVDALGALVDALERVNYDGPINDCEELDAAREEAATLLAAVRGQ